VVRLLMIALMLASLMMAVAIPDAFAGDALLFVGCYLAIQLGRHAFLTFAAADRGEPERERAGRILTWFAFAGVFWVAGALAEGEARTLLWLLALALDYGAPLTLFWVPGRPRLHSSTWEVETSHFSERFGDLGAGPDRRERDRLRDGVPDHGRDVVAVLHRGGADRRSATS
jgi:low temperature requirement protein LtrA